MLEEVVDKPLVIAMEVLDPEGCVMGPVRGINEEDATDDSLAPQNNTRTLPHRGVMEARYTTRRDDGYVTRPLIHPSDVEASLKCGLLADRRSYPTQC